MVAVADTIEQSDAVVIAGNRLPVDDAGARAQAGQCNMPAKYIWATAILT